MLRRFPRQRPFDENDRSVFEREESGRVGLPRANRSSFVQESGRNDSARSWHASDGFSDEEEKQVGMHEEVPTLIEKEMVAQGGEYSKAETAWGAHAVLDGTLVTGQNPASSKLCVEKFLELLAIKMTQVNE